MWAGGVMSWEGEREGREGVEGLISPTRGDVAAGKREASGRAVGKNTLHAMYRAPAAAQGAPIAKYLT